MADSVCDPDADGRGHHRSLNHGFTGHALHVLIRDVVGCRIDPMDRRVRLSLREAPLDWCRIAFHVGGDRIELARHRDGGDAVPDSAALPPGWRLEQDPDLSADRGP